MTIQLSAYRCITLRVIYYDHVLPPSGHHTNHVRAKEVGSFIDPHMLRMQTHSYIVINAFYMTE